VKAIQLNLDNKIINVLPKLNRRCKSVRINIKQDVVELVMPSAAYFARANRFLLQNKLWLGNKLALMPIPQSLITAEGIKLLDRQYFIKHEGRPGIYENYIVHNNLSQKLILLIKNFLWQEISNFASFMAKEIEVTYHKINIKDTSSRWGSCSSKKNLAFSWRLALAPRFVMEYVVIHELCHLIEFNHSKKFWQLVAKFCPHYQCALGFLKYQGQLLHSYH
jgi:predicted metal-dependent hydrolase